MSTSNIPRSCLAASILTVLAASSPMTHAADIGWWRVHADASQHDALPLHPASQDYDHFVWLQLDGDQADALRQAGHELHIAANPFQLDLGGHRFDPLVDGAPRASVDRAWQASLEPDWRLVQFDGPIRADWLSQLAAAGIEPVQYIHPYTYVVWADAASLARSAALPHVRWQGEFLPDYRHAPVFRRALSGPIEVEVLARPGLASLDTALRTQGTDILSRGLMDQHFEVIQLRVDANRMSALAALPGVYSVQPVVEPSTRSEMSVQINSGNVDGSGMAFPGYLTYLADIGVDGNGVIMACVDDGTTTSHPDLVNRILPCNGAPSCGTGIQGSGHGTHVAGIMVADGSSGSLNTGGFLRGLGMAPGARLVEQRYTNAIPAPAYLNRMRDSVRNNAVLSNNSWGGGGPAGYESTARQTDVGTRDADPDAAGDQPLLYVLAIDNGGGGTSSQGIPDEAKNLFTIGSAWAQVNANTQDTRNNDISSNSAHGPALDGRFIPHMIANSRFTDSTIGTNGYAMQGGTSQAAPHVAGASGLFFEYYRNAFGGDPSPAMVKAAFLAITRDLVGNLDANGGVLGPRPNPRQGWGRMQPHKVMAPDQPVVYIDQTHVFAATGETWTTRFNAVDPDEPMRLMLVWTDAPGHGLGGTTPAWNNDLDLRVTAADDSLYLGNVFASGWSATGGSPETRNNTEGVFLEASQHQGSIEVDVLAANITSNALPNAGSNNSQDFALACYNCAVDAGAGADLAISLTDVPDPVTAGGTLTYVVNVINLGTEDAINPVVQLDLPPEASFVSRLVGPSPLGLDWTCSPDGDGVQCSLDGVLPTASFAPSLTVETEIAVATPAGSISASAVVTSSTPDPEPGNNEASATTEVLASGELIFVDGFECAPGRPGC